jgi:LysR family transcriptional regulator, hydrogen peroxide-inducible genes activator
MDIEQIRHFLAVAHHRHFCRAAETCGLSQPGLSKSIQRLESILGRALFVRGPRNVALTALGQQLLPIFIEIDRAAQQVTMCVSAQHALRNGPVHAQRHTMAR